MKCPNCGSKVTEGSAFCENCGAKIPKESKKERKGVLSFLRCME